MKHKIYSFGFKYGLPPVNEHTASLDVRPFFGRNPYHDKALRGLRGTDLAVQEDVQKTPDFKAKYEALKGVVSSTIKFRDVWLGCTGGHHRSVYLAHRIGEELGVEVEHRDIDKGRERESFI